MGELAPVFLGDSAVGIVVSIPGLYRFASSETFPVFDNRGAARSFVGDGGVVSYHFIKKTSDIDIAQ